MGLNQWKILTVVVCLPFVVMWVHNRAGGGNLGWYRYDWLLAVIVGAMFAVLAL